ncbi:MAG: DUF3098 domain-containing protein [Flavobacteriales bacterium]|nr:DUF3098 domain-containing protein [Flavobacteriales bacterium]
MKNPIKHFGFNAENYKWLLIGLAINILGYILMIGGGSDDPAKFDANELFSTTRITIAPILILAGYVVIFYAIMKRGKSSSSEISVSEKNDSELLKTKK